MTLPGTSAQESHLTAIRRSLGALADSDEVDDRFIQYVLRLIDKAARVGAQRRVVEAISAAPGFRLQYDREWLKDTLSDLVFEIAEAGALPLGDVRAGLSRQLEQIDAAVPRDAATAVTDLHAQATDAMRKIAEELLNQLQQIHAARRSAADAEASPGVAGASSTGRAEARPKDAAPPSPMRDDFRIAKDVKKAFALGAAGTVAVSLITLCIQLGLGVDLEVALVADLIMRFVDAVIDELAAEFHSPSLSSEEKAVKDGISAHLPFDVPLEDPAEDQPLEPRPPTKNLG